MNVIDPNNPIPKYLQITAWIKELIQSGRYERGASLPSEVELAKICQVNRNTLRQAIETLAPDDKDNLLNRVANAEKKVSATAPEETTSSGSGKRRGK